MWGTGRPSERYIVSDPAEASFFFEMASLSRHGEAIPFEMVSQIYAGGAEDSRSAARHAQIRLDSLTRRLTKGGIDPERLFVKIRGVGWRLAADVLVRGLGSADRHDGDPILAADRESLRDAGIPLKRNDRT